MFKTTATFCEVEVAVGCWVLSLSTNYRDLSAIVSSAAPKKGCLFRHTSKTQGIGVGDRSRKMVLSRSLGVWSRFAQDWLFLIFWKVCLLYVGTLGTKCLPDREKFEWEGTVVYKSYISATGVDRAHSWAAPAKDACTAILSKLPNGGPIIFPLYLSRARRRSGRYSRLQLLWLYNVHETPIYVVMQERINHL